MCVCVCVCVCVRAGVLRGVSQGQHQRDADLRAPRRPHLRQDVQEPRRQHDGAQQPADEASDGSAGCSRRRPWRTIQSPAAVPAVLVSSLMAAAAAAARRSLSVGPVYSRSYSSLAAGVAEGESSEAERSVHRGRCMKFRSGVRILGMVCL